MQGFHEYYVYIGFFNNLMVLYFITRTHHTSSMDPKSANRGFLRLDSLEGPIPPLSPEEQHSPDTIPSPRVFDSMHHTQQQTDSEAKWFSPRKDDPSVSHNRNPHRSHTRPRSDEQQNRNRFHRHSSFHHHPHHRSQWRNQVRHQQSFPSHHHQQVSVQTPLNLMTGRLEIWPTTMVIPVGDISAGQTIMEPSSHHSPEVFNEEQAATLLHASASVGSYFSIPEVCNVFGTVWGTLNSLSSCVTSNLNPNVRPFTPLNPNAKEFQPAATATKVATAPMASSVSSPYLSGSSRSADSNKNSPSKEEAKVVSSEEDNTLPNVPAQSLLVRRPSKMKFQSLCQCQLHPVVVRQGQTPLKNHLPLTGKLIVNHALTLTSLGKLSAD